MQPVPPLNVDFIERVASVIFCITFIVLCCNSVICVFLYLGREHLQ